ncbi:TIGR01777 family oxidoreductase [Nonlabens tegetincola]|uniref:TIGR01777 family oxidoreductase n=1 Tax=Nonlabens tegetincola TaxID=323273 RepID=UPI000CF38D6B|nr:TIGR01777 family oxidoreductase [Nonlabens tegetincola]PQJ19115.1 TIGR01777 family protein [Nonlabens tegetincola]
MSKILIPGGTGFLGKSLSRYLKAQGHEVITLSRKRDSKSLYWDGENLGEWEKELETVDVIINLAGKSVDCRYNPANMKAILKSRLSSTAVLHKAVEKCSNRPRVWLNSSTATIYRHSETRPNTEKEGVLGDDFSTNVAQEWERVFFNKELPGTRKIAMRTSIVLGATGGAFPVIKRLTKVGLGGMQGKGQQMISWIHVDDFCRAVDFLIQSELEGVVNVTAPKPVSNKDFMFNLQKSLRIPIAISQPRWLLELGALFMKTETELVLKSRFVLPEKLENSGFKWDYNTHDAAVQDLI